ncbi:MAG: hypothetical protein DMF63_14375 [Acidobacteria bacterium]|nr:MAG: hypothetical protein DMF63_14375 [Acidobacteriota bacterium]
MFRGLQNFVSIFTLTSLIFSFFLIDGSGDVSAGGVEAATASGAELTRTDYGKLAMLFEQNKGQTDPAVRFVSRGPGYTLYLTDKGTEFSLAIPGESDVSKGEARREKLKSDRLQMKFVGANTNPIIAGSDVALTKTNYYIGMKRIENVSNYHRVDYKDLYEGIDAVFYGNATNQLEYDFIVAANANADRIRLRLEGTQSVSIDDDGDLVARTANTELKQKAPKAYQTIDGAKRQVDVSYAVVENEVAFKLGEYDHSQPLTIDPALSYLTYIGGTGFDNSRDVAVDPSGNAYVTGDTLSLNFHGQTRSDSDAGAAYVAKINPDGTAFVYVTILEGNGDDFGFGVTADANGNAYATGIASRFFPTTSGAFDTNHGILNAQDAYVTKLDPAGVIVYSTFLGGTDADAGADIAVDSSGKAYVVGNTFSNSAFPTKNRYQSCGIVSPLQTFDSQDAFLTVFNAAGSDITYSSCIGNTVGVVSLSDDSAIGVALDSSNNAYVTGETKSNTFKVKNAAQPNTGGGIDAFVAKFVPTQSGDASVAYATFLGGSGTDKGLGIAVTANGVASVTGITGSFNFPLKNAFDSTNQINEAFVTQYSSTGSLSNSSFLGGADQDEGDNIAVGNGGTIYVTGNTLSNDFPMAVPFQAARRGNRDAFITKVRFGINNNPGVASSSYLGGSGNDKAFGIGVLGNFIFVAGPTESNNLLTTTGAIKATSNASTANPDGFVAKILDSRKDTIGTFDPINTNFDLRNTLTAGAADILVERGIVGDVPVAGDFNGDGIDTVSTFNNGVWKIQNNNVIVSGYPVSPITVNFGQAGDLPVVGDWNNDGLETVGVYRPSAGQFLLTDALATTANPNPPVNLTETFGVAEDLPIAGDWDGDGIDSIAVFRPSVGQFFLANDNVQFPGIDLVTFFGTNGDLPVGGDWDGDGKDSIGVWRPSTQEFFLSNDNANIANQFVFGSPGDLPVVGDWDGKPNQ